jgi:hypothetical protein
MCAYTHQMSLRVTRRRMLAGTLSLIAAAGLTSLVRPGAVLADELGQLPGDAAVRPLDVRLLSPSFRLIVPFRTQKDGGRWQTSNCGPATLGMVLDGFGIDGHETDDLRLKMHTYQGTVGMRTGTGLEHVSRVADDLGIRAHGLYNPDGSYRIWQVSDVVTELRQGRPVMPLVRLYTVPGYEAMASRWGHYILLTGVTSDGIIFSDSLKTDPDAGSTGLISERQLAVAIANSHIPGQAVAFSGPRNLLIVAS